MRFQWRKVRAALSLGSIWGAVSMLLSAAGHAILQFVQVGSISWATVLEASLQYGVFGVAVGTAFAGTLVAFEGRNILERIKPWRIAVWGALMGGSFPLIIEVLEGGATLATLSAMMGTAGFAAGVGAALSVGTIVVAKAAKAELGAGDSDPTLAQVSDAEAIGPGK